MEFFPKALGPIFSNELKETKLNSVSSFVLNAAVPIDLILFSLSGQ
jgi:hypothetical protein